MKKVILTLNCIFLALLISCNQNTSSSNNQVVDAASTVPDTCKQVIDAAKWLVLCNNGKGDDAAHFDLKSAPTLLENYIENLKLIDQYSVEIDADYPKHFANDSLKIDSLGQWGSYLVFQVSNFYIMHRSVVLKDCKGNYRILYTEFDHIGAPISGTQVFAENSANDPQPLSIDRMRKEMLPKVLNNQLDIKAFVGGNKEYYEHYRFILTDSTQIPKLIP